MSKTATDVELFARRVMPDDVLPPELPQWAIDALKGPVWIIETSLGMPVCLGGFLPSEGVPRCSAWWHPLEEIYWASPFRLRGAIRRQVVCHAATHLCHRIEAHVLSDWRPGRVLAKACGFVYEGTMRRWGSAQEDFDLYRWEAR